MIKIAPSVAVAFGSMHWSLVTFSKPRLVTSDQPVVVWPLSRGRARPCRNNLNSGVTDTLEVFVPITPELLFLMAWVDDPDHPELITWRQPAHRNGERLRGRERRRSVVPPAGRQAVARYRRARPLSAELIPGYDVSAV